MEIVNVFLVVFVASAVCVTPFSHATEAGAQGEAVKRQEGFAIKSKVEFERKPQPQPEAKAKQTEVLPPGKAVVLADRVNVRGQARLESEVVGQLTNGEPVMVLQVITVEQAGPEEPSAWAKIALPTGIHPWVSAHFVDATSKRVDATKLNVRGGPGQNYSVLGLLQQGEVVKSLSARGDWLEIETPTHAYAFVAAQYLKPVATAIATPTVIATAPAIPPDTSWVPGAPEVATNSATVTPTTTVTRTVETAMATDPPAPTPTAVAPAPATSPETDAATGSFEVAKDSATVSLTTTVTLPPEAATETNSATTNPKTDAPVPATSPEANAPATTLAGAIKVEQPPAPATEQTNAAAKPEAIAGAIATKTAEESATAYAKSKHPTSSTTTNLETPTQFQAPPLPISAEKLARLKELTEKYKADQITPVEYHQQRAKVLAEP